MLYIQDTFLSTAGASVSPLHLFVLYNTQSASKSTRLTPKGKKQFVLPDPGALEMHQRQNPNSFKLEKEGGTTTR